MTPGRARVRARAGAFLHRNRTAAAAFTALMLALIVVGCTRYVTHENEGWSYEGTETQNGSYTWGPDSHPPNPPSAYHGQDEAWAHVDGGASGESWARGYFDVALPSSQEGNYGGAFYFPPGTFRGASPAQDGDIEIMGWSNSAGHRGGIRIDASDHKARLFRQQSQSSPTDDIGDPFVLREGCWNWLAVRQKVGQTDADSDNLLYLNGRQLFHVQKKNTYGTNPDRLRFGLVSVDQAQRNPLDMFVDYAYASHSEILPPNANACEDRPNVLFIVTDDQRIKTLAAADPNPGQTTWMPKTREWFDTGTAGTDGGTHYQYAFATTPLCCPSRSSIFTGLYAHNHSVRVNGDAKNLDPARSPTLQRYLHGAGYRTGIVGKYLNGWVSQSRDGNPVVFPPGAAPPDFDWWRIFDNGVYKPTSTDPSCPPPNIYQGMNCLAKSGPDPGDGPPDPNHPTTYYRAPPGSYATTYVGDRAVDFIDESEASDRQPWFLYVAPSAPHTGGLGQFSSADVVESKYQSIQVPPYVDNPASFDQTDLSGKPSYVNRTRNGNPAANPPSPGAVDVTSCPELATQPPNEPPGNVYKQCVQKHREAQYQMLKSVDDTVQQIFAELRSRGEEDNTLAFFISDNGHQWGEFWLEGKSHPYDHSVRIPFFMRWPGHVASNSIDQSHLVANIDLAPTALAAAGLAPESDKPIDGRNLFDSPPRDHLLLESWGPEAGLPQPSPSWAAIRTLGYQYTEYYENEPYPTYRDPTLTSFREYYDLAIDRWETTNKYGSDGQWENDPATSPDAPTLSNELATDRHCGRDGSTGIVGPPCP